MLRGCSGKGTGDAPWGRLPHFLVRGFSSRETETESGSAAHGPPRARTGTAPGSAPGTAPAPRSSGGPWPPRDLLGGHRGGERATPEIPGAHRGAPRRRGEGGRGLLPPSSRRGRAGWVRVGQPGATGAGPRGNTATPRRDPPRVPAPAPLALGPRGAAGAGPGRGVASQLRADPHSQKPFLRRQIGVAARGAARRVLRALRERGSGLTPLLQALGEPRPPPQLGPLLCNLSQLPEGRRGLLDRSRCSVQRLLPFTQYKDSTVHRRGIVGALRNCCFEAEDHEWLLSEEVDILPFLLLPLAGPEEFPEDEMERLPLDLQYLPQDKQREEEPDIRKMLLEAIMLVGPSGANHGIPGRKGPQGSSAPTFLAKARPRQAQPPVQLNSETSSGGEPTTSPGRLFQRRVVLIVENFPVGISPGVTCTRPPSSVRGTPCTKGLSTFFVATCRYWSEETRSPWHLLFSSLDKPNLSAFPHVAAQPRDHLRGPSLGPLQPGHSFFL
uniref:HGH1 homolog n=1 Tax=Otus sunia TaxID=257818 RepID=A0A8C8B089_9STRI